MSWFKNTILTVVTLLGLVACLTVSLDAVREFVARSTDSDPALLSLTSLVTAAACFVFLLGYALCSICSSNTEELDEQHLINGFEDEQLIAAEFGPGKLGERWSVCWVGDQYFVNHIQWIDEQGDIVAAAAAETFEEAREMYEKFAGLATKRDREAAAEPVPA